MQDMDERNPCVLALSAEWLQFMYLSPLNHTQCSNL